MQELLSVTITLATPLALGRTHFTLDGIAFGILQDFDAARGIDRDQTQMIPIYRTDEGLFFATAAEFERPVQSSETKIGGVRPVKDLADATRALSTTRKRHSKVVTTSGDTKAHLSRYRIIATPTIRWECVGDRAKLEALLSNASNIGALRKDGHGQIDSVSVQPLDHDDMKAILVNENGVRRPIPMELAHSLGMPSNAPTTIDSWRPAYWDQKNLAECLIPNPQEGAS